MSFGTPSSGRHGDTDGDASRDRENPAQVAEQVVMSRSAKSMAAV
jgi:hypothetical protein